MFLFTIHSCSEYKPYDPDVNELSLSIKNVELQMHSFSLCTVFDVTYDIRVIDLQLGVSYATNKNDVKRANHVSWIKHVGYPHYEHYIDDVAIEEHSYVAVLAVVDKQDTIWSDIVAAKVIQKEYDDSTLNGHRFIDLGLPSGTLWADCNIGADNPQELGDFFAWGETEPKDDKTWETYKYCNGNKYELTKYNNSTAYGNNPDSLTVLEDIDDAAHVIWGEGWHIPSPQQYQELLDYCNIYLMEHGKSKGIRVIGTNGHEIYMPGEVPLNGEYWTNSLYESYLGNRYAYVWLQRSTIQRLSHSQRCEIKLIRPVCKKEEE